MSAAPRKKCGLVTGPSSMELSRTKTRATAEAGGRKRPFYNPLPVRFRKDGFNHRQITRDGNAAIYEQTWTGCHNPSVCYEVIRIRQRDGFQIKGRFVEPAKIYPNPEAWGVDGFTLTDKDAAFAKLRQLESASSAVAP